MVNPVVFGLSALWGGVVWRMRGGAFAAATGIDLGTQVTRALCGVLLALPLAGAAHDARLLMIAPAIFLGLVCVGWAPFMAYGQDANRNVQKSPFRVLPRLMGIPRASRWTDAMGWLQIGPVCMAPSAAVLWWAHAAWWWLALPAVGFAGVYFACDEAGWRGWLPFCRAIDTPEAWAELCMGGLIGLALGAAVMGAL